MFVGIMFNSNRVSHVRRAVLVAVGFSNLWDYVSVRNFGGEICVSAEL
jgi:hypothetical protein